MNSHQNPVIEAESPGKEADGVTRLLLLADGTVLAHNLTPEMAQLLQELAPDDPVLRERGRLATPDSGDMSHASPLSAGK